MHVGAHVCDWRWSREARRGLCCLLVDGQRDGRGGHRRCVFECDVQGMQCTAERSSRRKDERLWKSNVVLWPRRFGGAEAKTGPRLGRREK
eukprot:6179732-Pleurochrysis_carterae.AAC.1